MTDDRLGMNCDVLIKSSVVTRGYEQNIDMSVRKYGVRYMAFDVNHSIVRGGEGEYEWECRNVEKMNVEQVAILLQMVACQGAVTEDQMARLDQLKMVEE